MKMFHFRQKLLTPGHCEFCGEKEIKEELMQGTFYRCPNCGMVHGEIHDRNNEYRQAWYKEYSQGR